MLADKILFCRNRIKIRKVMKILRSHFRVSNFSRLSVTKHLVIGIRPMVPVQNRGPLEDI